MHSFPIKLSLVIALVLNSFFSFAQGLSSLENQIEDILNKYDSKVGVAIHNQAFTDSIMLNADHHYPFQSLYKFHLAIAVLDQVDQGKLSLNQPVRISKEMVNTDMYSPIKDKFPNGTTLPLSQVIFHTVAESDNVGCDVLFELVGGPERVQHYFDDKGYSNLSIQLIEAIQQANWNLQYQNWTTVGSNNKIFYDYYTNAKKLLSASSHKFLWDTMRATSTGLDRLKGLLPAGVIVAHKTGYSGAHKTTGEIAAVNDAGVIRLPNGDVFFITVLVTDSKETEPDNAKTIAEVTKVAYDYFVNQ
ncbi:MAG: class A beta-lactamase [Sphingobacterium sp.]